MQASQGSPMRGGMGKYFALPGEKKEALGCNRSIKAAYFLKSITVGVYVLCSTNKYYLLNAVGYFATAVVYS